jgi:hypothetical protein
MTVLTVLSYLFFCKIFVKIMTSSLLSPVFVPPLREKQRRLLKHSGKQTSMNRQTSSACCHIARSGDGNCHILPTVVTSGNRRDLPMWRCNSWVHLICVVSLLGNVTLTAASTGEWLATDSSMGNCASKPHSSLLPLFSHYFHFVKLTAQVRIIWHLIRETTYELW